MYSQRAKELYDINKFMSTSDTISDRWDQSP